MNVTDVINYEFFTKSRKIILLYKNR